MTETGTSTIQWRWWLPLAEFLLCLGLLMPLLPLVYLQLATGEAFPGYQRTNGEGGSSQATGEPSRPAINIEFPAEGSPASRRLMLARIRFQVPIALNLPAASFELPYSIATTRAYVPQAVLLEHWRAITWSIFGTVFWFVLGRAIEVMSSLRRGAASPRLNVLDGVAATVALAIGALETGLLLMEGAGNPARGDDGKMLLVGLGGVLWLILSLIIFAAIAWQWRVRRRERAQVTEAA